MRTHHSNAPKAAAAFMELQTLPPHQTPETVPNAAAKATKPANQNTIVKASTPRRANFGVAEGRKRGARKMDGIVITRVKTPVKMRKLTWEGEVLKMVSLLYQEATMQRSQRMKRLLVASWETGAYHMRRAQRRGGRKGLARCATEGGGFRDSF